MTEPKQPQSYRQQTLALTSRLNLQPALATQVLSVVLGRRGKDMRPHEPLEPFEKLTLVMATWLYAVMAVPPDKLVPLLIELQPLFQEVAPRAHRAWNDGTKTAPVPSEELAFAENLFVTWTNQDEFYDLRTMEYINPLPRNPRWRTSVHLAAMYFFGEELMASKERKDANQAVQAQGETG